MLSSDTSSSRRPAILAYRPPPAEGRYASSILNRISADLALRGDKVHILDLGRCSRETFESFSAKRCQISFEDLGAAIAPGQPEDKRHLIESLACLPSRHPLDLVLCWDTLNYLTPPELSRLFAALAASVTRQSPVHMLLWTLLRCPESPGEFSLVQGAQVKYLLPQSLRECTRYSPRDLEKMIPEFKTDRVVLLQDGWYEVVMSLA